MLSMRDQVVLVTGAHGGIGAAMVSAFAESDATVIGSDRGTERPDAVAAYYDCDVTDEAAAAGTFTIVRETARAMLDRDTKGTMLLFSSVAAKEGRRTYLPYNASKIAVLHIMWSMAKILGPAGVSVNAITPGPVGTEMWAQFAELPCSSLIPRTATSPG